MRCFLSAFCHRSHKLLSASGKLAFCCWRPAAAGAELVLVLVMFSFLLMLLLLLLVLGDCADHTLRLTLVSRAHAGALCA